MNALQASPTPSKDDIQALFDRIAPVYDDFNQQLSLGLHRIWKQMTVDWSQAAPGDTCLDICCGSGDLALLLAQRVGQSGHVYGLDFSPAQLAIAHQKAAHYSGIATLHWVEGDALNLPFEDNRFDAVTMAYGLRNLIDIPQGLKEVRRVLSNHGKAAILDFHRPQSALMSRFQQWYLDTVVVSAAERCGLTDEYAYINPSIERFPVGSQQVQLAYEVGFVEAIHYSIAGGMMGVLVLT
ncbi:bifunctional demethylmenaquinone methyltransferase/2-methoxy-6-polyprenyl-1,4-benzoquinol methylase UbiE [Oscillatoria sp. CS-180]|uniref:bifunctional demethylmenaquinone methyltransferase/2-methoxy-6-polyprenyl-1,4-benzoquinol methylase UbiE n=1 Tax=Oscillatoria sp. CS-180 TaxID=3021720 RepID=UPI00232E973E|nr:bifunctional demethylmenaquinone methyltransferase/2-methoxy-6-polyprenyl-1,4-benzoquinol methylase UbiE [Oscillatoria sp. CS-180]MDB9526071.1 bifunctional demethylmenaquinone methyltransferase/2-methoxy-6-polyprenyl-1,4-benzoquinol methylase UbiE [Oscillatoria sp. CS-180]